MLKRYILNNGEPELCGDLETWGLWMNGAERVIGNDTINGLTVSTVFIGLDHQFGDGPPLLFETMIFDTIEGRNHSLDQWQERCSALDQAKEMHARALKIATETAL